MTGLDIFLVILFITVIALETIRGFWIAVFDSVALYSALLLSVIAAPSLSNSLFGSSVPGSGLADVQLAALVFFSVVFIVVAKLSYNALNWDIGMFDHLGGLVAGIVAAVVFGHAIVAGLASGNEQQSSITSGNLSQELLTFSTYHQVIDGIGSAIGTHSDNS
jgi:uncharacterized membrane protein required for colicin V production